MGTSFLQLGQRQPGHQAHFVPGLVVDRLRTDATQQVGAFKIVAFRNKHGIHVHAIDDADIHIVREHDETGEQSVQVILDLIANLSGIVSLQHHRPGIPGAKVTPIRQLGAILDWQAADRTPGQFNAVGTDLFLLTGDLVSKKINLAGNGLAANGANISPGRQQRAKTKTGQQQ